MEEIKEHEWILGKKFASSGGFLQPIGEYMEQDEDNYNSKAKGIQLRSKPSRLGAGL